MKLIHELVRDALEIGSNDMERWLETHVSEKVQQNVQILHYEAHDPMLLHISTDSAVKAFVPYISKRQAPSEDRTTPRVVCAPTIFGCIIGYAQTLEDFLYALHSKKKDSQFNWRSGYYIYAMAYEYALKPNAKLVFDAERSGETWLVPYNRAHALYVPDKVGKFFVRAVTYTANGRVEPTADVECYFEINHLNGLAFSQSIRLTKGFWRVDFPYLGAKQNAWNKDRQFRAVQIEKSEFLAVKSESAALLGYTEPPSYLTW